MIFDKSSIELYLFFDDLDGSAVVFGHSHFVLVDEVGKVLIEDVLNCFSEVYVVGRYCITRYLAGAWSSSIADEGPPERCLER